MGVSSYGRDDPPMTAAGCTSAFAVLTSRVSPLPAVEFSPAFLVQWSGGETGGPGVADYTIYVSDNGGTFTPWLTHTSDTQAMYTGAQGHTYGFYSVARDLAGGVEAPKNFAEAATQVADTTKPVSHVSPLPATEASPNFLVQWSGTDVGSGIRDYTIYRSDNGGPFSAWLTQTALTQAWYAGFLGHTYAFLSVARDKAGNVEDLKSTPEASTQAPGQMAADVNGDGQINCADVTIIKASFGKKSGQAGFEPRADINKDGIVNVVDLSLVTQKLAAGAVCQ